MTSLRVPHPMSAARRGLAVLVLVGSLAALFTGCGDDVDGREVGTGGSGSRPALRPDEVALRIHTSSSWVGQGSVGPPLPGLTVYGDGRVFLSRFDRTGSGMHRSLLHGRLTGDSLRRLVGRARDLRIGDDTVDYGTPGLDGSTTLVSIGPGSGLTAGGVIRTTSVWTLEASGYEGEAGANRRKLAAFVEDVEAASTAVGEPWEPAKVAVFAETDRLDVDEPRTWPVEAVDPSAGDEVPGRDDLRCQVVDGKDGAAVLAAVAEQPLPEGGHTWQVGDGTFGVGARPLLPGERTCADVDWPS